jgi:hypothetical protein
MQIKDLDELEMQLNQINWSLDKVESLSRILLDCIREGENLKSKDVENLTSVLNEKITKIKKRFNALPWPLGGEGDFQRERNREC